MTQTSFTMTSCITFFTYTFKPIQQVFTHAIATVNVFSLTFIDFYNEQKSKTLHLGGHYMHV